MSDKPGPIGLNGIIGPRGDGYAPREIAAREAEQYDSRQIGRLAETEVEMETATTFAQSEEASGFVRAAGEVFGVGIDLHIAV